MNSARVPAVSPLRKPAKISKKPPVNAQISTISTSTSTSRAWDASDPAWVTIAAATKGRAGVPERGSVVR
jgi:hypothetical protein